MPELPAALDVAYFVKLHLDTVNPSEKVSSGQNGEFRYQIMGKPRPMLVLSRLDQVERGRAWFLAAALTSKGHDPRGMPRPNYEPIGRSVFPDRDSFIVLCPQRIPENLLDAGGRRSAVVKPHDRLASQNVFRIIAHKLLKQPAGDVLARHF